MALYDKALNRFEFALTHNRNSILDFNLKWFDNSKVTWELYRDLVKLLESLKVEVKLSSDLGTRMDINNKPFKVGGLWDHKQQAVYLASFSYMVLAHECAHVIDSRVQNEPVQGMECEVVASAASYIFICERVGPYSPLEAVEYAKLHGANIKDLRSLKQRIIDVFWNMYLGQINPLE